MALFGKQKAKPFFTSEQQTRIVTAVKEAEQQTSGEVRIFVESKCTYMDALDRAKEIFFNLKMDKTVLRNAVLFYIAIDDRQMAVFADEGIHEKTGQAYWTNEVKEMLAYFRNFQVVDGLIHSIHHVGQALQQYFPYDTATDKNELPDDIVFGK